MEEHLFACLRSAGAQEAVVAIARDFSPRIQRHGASSVVLDVGGLGRLLGDPHAIADELARAALGRGVMLRVAVAPTQVGARLLALARAGRTVITADIASALADVPLVHLQQLLAEMHGITSLLATNVPAQPPAATDSRRGGHRRPAINAGAVRSGNASTTTSWMWQERAFDVLRRWGLTTLGEFTALPASELSARMRQEGVVLQQLARGIDLAPLVPDRDVPRFLERMELEWPIDALEPLSFVFARMLDPLSASLERADRGAAAIRLDLRLVDRTTHARVLQLPAPIRDARVLRTLLLLDLESHAPPAAIDVVTIEIDPAPGRVIQYSLLERALPSAETIATLTARLGALAGESRCGSPALLDTHRPDGFAMRPFNPDERDGTDSALRASSHRSPNRTSGTLRRDLAEVRPDLRAERRRTRLARAGAAGVIASSTGVGERTRVVPVLRRFRPPVAIRVTVEHGRPVRVAIDRRGMPGGHVEEAAGPWRTSGEWWDGMGTAWNRDEWDVAFRDGSVCRLFHDRENGRWFLEGILD
jgi:protein ImuB